MAIRYQAAPYEKFLGQLNSAMERKAAKFAAEFDYAKHGCKVEIFLHPDAPDKIHAAATKAAKCSGVQLGLFNEDSREYIAAQNRADAAELVQDFEGATLLREYAAAKSPLTSRVTKSPDIVATAAAIDGRGVEVAKPAQKPRSAKPAAEKPAEVVTAAIDAKPAAEKPARKPRSAKPAAKPAEVAAAVIVAKPAAEKPAADFVDYVGNVSGRIAKLLARLAIAKARQLVSRGLAKLTRHVEAAEKL